jgi:hypothetical protein
MRVRVCVCVWERAYTRTSHAYSQWRAGQRGARGTLGTSATAGPMPCKRYGLTRAACQTQARHATCHTHLVSQPRVWPWLAGTAALGLQWGQRGVLEHGRPASPNTRITRVAYGAIRKSADPYDTLARIDRTLEPWPPPTRLPSVLPRRKLLRPICTRKGATNQAASLLSRCCPMPRAGATTSLACLPSM